MSISDVLDYKSINLSILDFKHSIQEEARQEVLDYKSIHIGF